MNDIINHGGKRKNAGRPKGEGTKMVRVPLGCLEQVRTIISVYRLGDISLVSEEQLLKLNAEQNTRKRVAKKLQHSVDDPVMDEITNKIKEKSKKNIHPDIEEIKLGFKKLSRQQRRRLIKQHGSEDKAIQVFIRKKINLK